MAEMYWTFFVEHKIVYKKVRESIYLSTIALTLEAPESTRENVRLRAILESALLPFLNEQM